LTGASFVSARFDVPKTIEPGAQLDRTFEDVADAQLIADLPGVDAFAFIGKGGVAGDHETVADAREFGREVFGDAVGEIVLRRIA
jgi:hypothetical protein